ncbi:RNA-binding domain superfamily [Sesbania bispinosa]|nr:RNA-binding domain superfamily [Sesbania bispinosa]
MVCEWQKGGAKSNSPPFSKGPMWKMGSVFRATLQRSNSSVCALQRTHGLQAFWPRCFSTEAEQPPQDSTTPIRQFLETDHSGLTYGRLHGIHKYMLKTDAINFLEGSNLTLEDVKVEYTRNFSPFAMMLQFPTRNAYDSAVRLLIRKGRLYKMERADRAQWDIVTPYDGKLYGTKACVVGQCIKSPQILIKGIPRNANFEDVERILFGCEYDPSSINLFLRSGEGTEPIKMATVRFPSRTQAMNAFITKNGTFCQNNRILVQVLQ